MSKKGILLCGHGTRLEEGVKAFHDFAKGFQNHLEGYEATAAFLELAEPNFDMGIKNLVDRGVTEIIALPLFLFTGVHTEKDIPCMLYQAAKKHGVSIKMGGFMGVCEEMVDIAEQLIKAVMPVKFIENPEDTALVVAGVGSSKIKANADISALTRLIQERFHIPFATVGFLSRMTFPALPHVFRNIGFLPYKNIVVLPYFFFKGIYSKRAEMAVEKSMKHNPDKHFVMTDLLASNQGLYELLKKRLDEVLEGKVDVIKTIEKEVLENYDHHHHCQGHHHHHHEDTHSGHKGKCKHRKQVSEKKCKHAKR